MVCFDHSKKKKNLCSLTRELCVRMFLLVRICLAWIWGGSSYIKKNQNKLLLSSFVNNFCMKMSILEKKLIIKGICLSATKLPEGKV